MKLIPLTQGKFAMVDDSGFEYLNQWKWAYHKDYNTGYAFRFDYTNDYRKPKHILMHRLIIEIPLGYQPDHKNGDGLDNRRSNLRICTPIQNSMNRGLRKDNKSGYKGVSFLKFGSRIKRWLSLIYVNKKRIFLGNFITPEEAAKAYNKAALQFFGEYARLNII